ncbi:MAG: DUF1570 domain-containing protein [Isosphaeraceae bacterium]
MLRMTWLVVGLGLVLVGQTRADVVEFTEGGRVELPAVDMGAAVRLDGPTGPVVFRKAEIRSILPRPLPAREWPAQRASALVSGADARFQTAWWALMNGLTSEAVAMLREAHQADPQHQPTTRMVAMLDRLDRPGLDPDLNTFRARLPGDWRLAKGSHVVLAHQHNSAEATERVELLEQVFTSYYLFVTALGFDLTTPSERLVSVWFAKRDDYLAYLRNEEADAFLTTRGFYHPTKDLVLTYDSRTDLSRARVRDRLERPGGTDLRRKILFELEWRALDWGTASHEMVHQLVAHSGFAPRADAFPLWFHEGFAAQFEVIVGGRWAGIGQPHPLRMADWPKGEPPALASLIRDQGFGQGYRAGSYVQAWALVDYLRREHPGQFVTFLDLLRGPGSGLDRTFAAFRTSFGDDLIPIEQGWLKHAASLRALPR